MMRSLFAGVSGLKNHQTRMDVIGNNIANVNTVGFKASRVNFQDVLSQTLQGAAGASGNRGGTNPMQVGLGMGLASVDTVFTDGSFQPTGKQTDLSIKGQGFFILNDGNSQVFTRAGNFDFDSAGNFLVPGTGYKVMGWMADTTGNINTNATVSNIKVAVGSTMPAKATQTVTYSNNLSADAAIGTSVPTSINVYDTLGNAYKVDAQFTKSAAGVWDYTITDVTSNGVSIGAANINYGGASGAGAPLADTNISIAFNSTTGQYSGYNAGNTAQSVVLTLGGGIPNLVLTPTFNATGSAMTQFGGQSTVQAVTQNGYSAGTLDSTMIDPSGVIYGRFTNGQSQKMAQVALATFNNPGGLTKSGDNLFIKSNNSGEAQIGPTGTGGRGTFNPGTLEMANVDLAQEFSNMIITQRGFQANSKIISVTDEMLQELANLKR